MKLIKVLTPCNLLIIAILACSSLFPAIRKCGHSLDNDPEDQVSRQFTGIRSFSPLLSCARASFARLSPIFSFYAYTLNFRLCPYFFPTVPYFSRFLVPPV
ncbi:hypothetical protein PUN28_015491 [Cardiocondyla obscurior]|uniref:Secreted protein n=1 Tax=Cardiocondyla obscurior TaxID=286306 RepID=A0AAW2ETA9_9HYME